MKRFVSFLVAAVMALSVFGALHIAAPLKASAESTNLALGKTVTQDLNGCAAMGGNPGDLWYYGYLTDGERFDNTTYDGGTPACDHYGWYVVKTGYDEMNASAIIDLGSVQQICRIKIYTEYHFLGLKFPNTYDVYVSADGENWTKVYGEAGRTGYTSHAKEVEFDRTNARYVKVTIVHGNDVVGGDTYTQYAGIGEVEVYNTYVSGNIAAYKTAKESGSGSVFAEMGAGWNYDTVTGPSVPYAFGPYNMTGWIVVGSAASSIRQEIDLHAVYNINQIKLVPMPWHEGNGNPGWFMPDTYEIYVSEDGADWTRVYYGENEGNWNVAGVTKTINIDPINARYISIGVIRGTLRDAGDYWTGLGGIEVYGTFVRGGYAEQPGTLYFDVSELTAYQVFAGAPFTVTQSSEGVTVAKQPNTDPGWTTYQGGDPNGYIYIALPRSINAEYPLYAIEGSSNTGAAVAVGYDGFAWFTSMSFGPQTSVQVVGQAGNITFVPLAIMGDGVDFTVKAISFYKTIEDYVGDMCDRGYDMYGANSASVTLSDSLSVSFRACFPKDVVDPVLRVTDQYGTTDLRPVSPAPGGHYYFEYKGIYPQKIADVVQLDILDGENAIANSRPTGFSVQGYLDQLYQQPAANFGYTEDQKAVMNTLIADLLTYGGASQVYKNYNLANLADSYDWIASVKTPANTYTPKSVKAVTKTSTDDKFTAATLLCDNTLQIKVKFKATNAAAVKFKVGTAVTVVPAADWEADEDQFTALSAPIIAGRLSKTVEITLIDASETVLAGIKYSVESYLASGACDDADFADALLNYGRSAKAFIDAFNSQELVTLVLPESNLTFDKTFAGDVLSLNISDASDEFKAELGLAGSRDVITKALLQNYKFTVKGQINYNKAASDRSHTSAFTYAVGKIMYKGELRDILAVVVEGSESEGEWYSNIDFAPSHDSNTKYAENFLAVAQNIFSYIQPEIDNLDEPLVVFTGFSRGAAAANLLGTLYNAAYGPDNGFIYTYATPATVRSADVAAGPNIFNVINPADLVTKVPFSFMGYYRAGNDVLLTPDSSALSVTNGLANAINGFDSSITIQDVYETKYSTSGSGTSSSGRTIYSYFEDYVPKIFTGDTNSITSDAISIVYMNGISNSSKLKPIKDMFSYAISNISGVQGVGAQHKLDLYFDLIDAL